MATKVANFVAATKLLGIMKTLSPLTDPVFDENRSYNALDRFFLKLIRDKRDLPFIYTAIEISAVLVTLGVLLYMPFVTGWMWWTVSFLYFLVNNFVYKGSFGLMMHCTSHRKWFKKEYGIFNLYLPWFLGLFFGQTPETYFSHHIGMHHPENNMPEDGSSTMAYQRDSFPSFLSYFAKFLFVGIIGLTGYFLRHKRMRFFQKAVTGEMVFLVLCALLSYFVSFPATFMVFIFPFLVSRFIMMVGNFAQHTFVDPEDPDNAYKNSITCINIKYNHKCWNDGYHISHHLAPTMHYTDHPKYFMDTLDEMEKNKALVFDGIGFLGVFIMTMTKRYDKLARHIVNINGMWSSEEEVIEVMKYRTKRIPTHSFSPAT